MCSSIIILTAGFSISGYLYLDPMKEKQMFIAQWSWAVMFGKKNPEVLLKR